MFLNKAICERTNLCVNNAEHDTIDANWCKINREPTRECIN